MIIGHGSKLQIGSGGNSETFTDLACISIDTGSNKVDAPESTDMLTPGKTRTYIGGLENPGDISIKYYFKPGDAGQAALSTAKDSAVHDFKIVYPGGILTEAFSGIVTSIDKSLPDDKGIVYTAKIQKSGDTTITTGS